MRRSCGRDRLTSSQAAHGKVPKWQATPRSGASRSESATSSSTGRSSPQPCGDASVWWFTSRSGGSARAGGPNRPLPADRPEEAPGRGLINLPQGSLHVINGPVPRSWFPVLAGGYHPSVVAGGDSTVQHNTRLSRNPKSGQEPKRNRFPLSSRNRFWEPQRNWFGTRTMTRERQASSSSVRIFQPGGRPRQGRPRMSAQGGPGAGGGLVSLQFLAGFPAGHHRPGSPGLRR